MKPIQLHGHIVTEHEVLSNHGMEIVNGTIRRIYPLDPAGEHTGPGEVFILPGFRDQHIHDLVGQRLAETGSMDDLLNRFEQTTRMLAGHGVTGVYLATFGDKVEHLETYCKAAKHWMDLQDRRAGGARLNGIFIEGTYLNTECRGAQPAEHCLTPEHREYRSSLERFYETGGMKMVNIAPDYGAPSLELIQRARQLGILTGSGHLKPPADLLKQAFETCELQFMVHFTNGPTGQSFKPFGGGGAFEGAMNLPIVKELILDYVHVDERYVLDIIHRTDERWGDDKIIAVTDALFPDTGEIPKQQFQIGSTLASVDPTGTYLQTLAYQDESGKPRPAPPNTLCSSIVTMDRVFSNLVSSWTRSVIGHWFDHHPRERNEALVKAARLCATNQARLDGTYPQTGSIAPGKQADLVVGELTGRQGNYRFEVKQTYVHGRLVFSNSLP